MAKLDYKFPRKFLIDPKKSEQAIRRLVRLVETMQIEIKKALTDVYYIAASVDIIDGNGTTSDSLSDLQVYLDGNYYTVAEVTGVPGIEVEVVFTDIKSISSIIISAVYIGSATHAVRVGLYNYDTTSWDIIDTLNNGLDWEHHLIKVVDDANYISGEEAAVRFYHTETGNASHDLYIEYVGLRE